MSYWLEDANEEYLGDFASNMGLAAMRDSGPEPLRQFIAEGEADEDLIRSVIDATRGDKALGYIAEMLEDAEPPVFLTDGSGMEGGDEDEDEDDA